MSQTRQWCLSLAVAGVVVLAGGVDPAAAVLDLTGTWEGSFKCDAHTAIGTIQSNETDTILITQTGNDLNIEAGGEISNGIAIEDPNKPERGALAFLRCGSTAEPLNFTSGYAKATVGTGGGGAMKGLFTIGVPGVIGRCTFTAKRISTTNPTVPACP